MILLSLISLSNNLKKWFFDRIKHPLGSGKMTIDRKKLIEKRGSLVDITYLGLDNKECFAIGWFFQLTETHARLKVTSTAGDSYESLDIGIDKIQEIKTFEMG